MKPVLSEPKFEDLFWGPVGGACLSLDESRRVCDADRSIKQGNSDVIGAGQRAPFLLHRFLWANKEMMKDVAFIRISPFGNQPMVTRLGANTYKNFYD